MTGQTLIVESIESCKPEGRCLRNVTPHGYTFLSRIDLRVLYDLSQPSAHEKEAEDRSNSVIPGTDPRLDPGLELCESLNISAGKGFSLTGA